MDSVRVGVREPVFIVFRNYGLIQAVNYRKIVWKLQWIDWDKGGLANCGFK